MNITLNLGFIFSFGTLFIDIMDTFNVSRTEAALVQSTMMAVAHGMGMFNGFIVEKLGPMWAGIIAASLSSVGLIASFFATSVIYLVVSVGIVSAPGYLSLLICSAVTTKRYFPGTLGPVAMSFAHVGSAVGGMAYPFFLRYLTDHYGLRGTLLINGGVLLNTIPFSLFCRSVVKPKQTDVTQTDDVITNVVNIINAQPDHSQSDSGEVHDAIYDNKAFIAETCLDSIQNVAFNDDVTKQIHEQGIVLELHVELENGVNKSDIFSKGVKDYKNSTDNGIDQTEHKLIRKKDSTMKNDNQSVKDNALDTALRTRNETRRNSVFLPALLTIKNAEYNTIGTVGETKRKSVFQNMLRAIQNRAYFLYAIGMALACLLISVVFIFIVDIFSDADLTVTDAALGLLLTQLTSAIGRLLPGFMIQLKFITTLTVPTIACVGLSATAMAVLLFKPLAMKLLFLGLFGIFYGMFVVCYGVVAMRICHDEYMSNGIGLSLTLSGITIAAFGPVTGWIRDETGTYLVPFLTCMGVNVVAVTLFLSAQILRNRQKKQPPSEVDLDTDNDCVTHL